MPVKAGIQTPRGIFEHLTFALNAELLSLQRRGPFDIRSGDTTPLPRETQECRRSAKCFIVFSRLSHRAARPGPSELYGWLVLAEGAIIVLFPHLFAAVLHLAALVEQAASYFRLAGILVTGIGMLYVMSGRLNAEGFVFASLLDRPLVPIAAGILWYMEMIPGTLALLFSIEDFGSFLWTLLTWRR